MTMAKNDVMVRGCDNRLNNSRCVCVFMHMKGWMKYWMNELRTDAILHMKSICVSLRRRFFDPLVQTGHTSCACIAKYTKP